MNAAAYITTSWDDGHPLDLRVADLLANHNLQGTFYVPMRTPKGNLTPAQVRELADAFEIGAHTLHHVFLTRTDDAEGEREIAQSKQWIEQTTGKPCDMFCPPGGKYTRGHLLVMERAGFVGFRSVELLSLALPRKRGGLWELSTTLQAYPHLPMSYARNALKRGALSNLSRFLLHGRGREWPQLAQAMLERVATRGGVFHLWGHSWEIERMNEWQRLENVLRLMSQYTRDVPCVTNGEVCRRMTTPVVAPTPLPRPVPGS